MVYALMPYVPDYFPRLCKNKMSSLEERLEGELRGKNPAEVCWLCFFIASFVCSTGWGVRRHWQSV